jgi:asparagine synthase (glutamine-hydrolysing)
MCGIFGSFGYDGTRLSNAVIAKLSGAIRHRGPDADGHYCDEHAVLGNTRLAIVDLSTASDQPLYSDDGDIVLVQNGEIYNYIELREELRRLGARFSSQGDTEVLLRAFEIWGPDFVTRLNGMFAIAVFEKKYQRLWLYRDRLGVKPLYLAGGEKGERLWFASEIKAILANGNTYSPDLDSFAQFFALNYIPQPSTAFAGIRHLPPGHRAEISADKGVQITRYWDLADVTEQTDMSEAEGQAGLVRILDDATRIRMRADAPFGAFLSGGLDSSSVVAFMSMYQTAPVRTFSIGFDDPRFDETRFARMAAKRFGTLHEMRIFTQDSYAMWPRFIWHCDQPHGDVSFMPTDQVAALAARDVKMVLTGDGADELFAGYEKYLDLFPGGQIGHLGANWEDDFVRASGLLVGSQADELLAGPLKQAFKDTDPYRAMSGEIRRAQHLDPINRVLFAETTTLLPGNNLVKPDRMAMANSVEVRSPFLDYRMAEFAFSIPGALKLKGGETKALYKRAVEPFLGSELTYRRKQMFTVPVGEWLRQALAGYTRDMLLDGRLEARGLFQIDTLQRMVSQHIAGTANLTRQLRALISVEIWFRLFVDKDAEMLEQAKLSPL